MTLLDKYLRDTDRSFEISFGIGLLAAVGVFGYFGARGAWAYLRGSRQAPADPLASTIGLVVSIWLTYVALRLLTGRHRERPLFPGVTLLAASAAVLAGTGWFLFLAYQVHPSLQEHVRIILVGGGVGVLGFLLWWQRRQRSR